MVTTSFTKTLVRQLEMYLLQSTNFELTGQNYDLLLFLSGEEYIYKQQYSLLISAKALNKRSQREVIKELLLSFKSILDPEDYALISTLNILDSEAPLVKNINFAFPFHKNEEAEIIVNTTIGGFTLNNATLVRSAVLSNLIRQQDVRIHTITGEYIVGNVQSVDRYFFVHLGPTSNQMPTSKTRTVAFDKIESVALLINKDKY